MCFIEGHSNVNRGGSDPRVRYDLRSRNVIMTISGTEQDSSDMDYQYNDPHILPVHLYRAPPPSYSELTETKQNLTAQQPQLQGRSNSATINENETSIHQTNPTEAPPPYENIQPRATLQIR